MTQVDDPATRLDDPHAELLRQLQGLLAHERDALANAANMAALVYQHLPELNWAGWYFGRGDELVLGPFQGKPACVRIGRGKGVCGAAALERRSQRVPDVHAFPGHIACDAASRSELVVPVLSVRLARWSSASQARLWLGFPATLRVVVSPAMS